MGHVYKYTPRIKFRDKLMTLKNILKETSKLVEY